ncbi:LytR/AlgR family response regulator transcription factor [Allofournierella sp.]|uniref:LytR/AlgR family response regulator transcription factor n=1 Tax=Allofournierella sp. TaxID=1940256 RepID=UPI003AB7A4EA
MYRIAICDDEPEARSAIRGLARQILLAEGQACEITEYAAPEALLQALGQGSGLCDLILLDIMFPGPGQDGLAFARRLRELRLGVSIVLISASPDYVLEGYGVQAVRYLLKPLEPEKLRAALLYDLHNHFPHRALTLFTKGGQVTVHQQDILYLESHGHSTCVHLLGGRVIPVAQKLSALEILLDSRHFCSCHKSFCVNLNHAASLRRYSLTLRGGEMVPVSKAKFSMFRGVFIKFSSLSS